MRVAVWTLAIFITVMLGYLAYEQWLPSGHGTLVVTSEPNGAQIWLDLKPTAYLTNGRLDFIPNGKHSVMVKLDTLEPDPVAQVVEIRSGKIDSVRFRLLPPQRGGRGAAPAQPAAVPLTADDSLATPPKLPPPSPAPSDSQPHPAVETKESANLAEPVSSTGVLEIVTSVAGAQIFVNDQPQSDRAPVDLKLPLGTYTVRVELANHTSDPPDQTISILRGSTTQLVYFTLAPTETRQILAETAPIAAPIFINGAPVGSGKVSAPREYGSYTVSFADSTGWRTPEPVHLSVTPSQPQPVAKGLYTRAFRASVQVVNGQAESDGNIHWSVGAWFEEEGAKPSVSLGPRIRQIPDSPEYGWELGEGDPNRNPTGGDYIEFRFTLPPDADPNGPLNLRLYLYRSNKRYAFSLKGQAELVVTVNGHMFLDGFRPQYGTEAATQNRYEEWTLKGMLVPGENRIMIHSGEHNSLFNYLRKIEIL